MRGGLQILGQTTGKFFATRCVINTAFFVLMNLSGDLRSFLREDVPGSDFFQNLLNNRTACGLVESSALRVQERRGYDGCKDNEDRGAHLSSLVHNGHLGITPSDFHASSNSLMEPSRNTTAISSVNTARAGAASFGGIVFATINIAAP